jgi:deoxyribonuclease IV
VRVHDRRARGADSIPGGSQVKEGDHAGLLGAHVSARGGVHLAPARAREIGATAFQLFTKTPNQWREPLLSSATRDAFRRETARLGIRAVVAHDSYLINLASPEPGLSRRSLDAFVKELGRCEMLGIPYLVSHPGDYIDERAAGLRRNAERYAEALRLVPGRVVVLLETTAGSGTALGSTFEELAALRKALPSPLRKRVAFCADTCHLYAAGYDLRREYDRIWDRWERVLGLARLRCLHLNDSRTPLGSRRDWHALIGEGTLGPEPFRRIMRDPRLAHVIKIIETPKGDDPVATDRRMLGRLRRYARPVARRPR